ncbi:MAG: hypothetical protein M3460_25525 [Actinomycetota bacterium]|nr:hypothetical protein [Actinomycetota bacterium]
MTYNEHYTETHATEPVLFLAFELSEKTWKLGFTRRVAYPALDCLNPNLRKVQMSLYRAKTRYPPVTWCFVAPM